MTLVFFMNRTKSLIMKSSNVPASAVLKKRFYTTNFAGWDIAQGAFVWRAWQGPTTTEWTKEEVPRPTEEDLDLFWDPRRLRPRTTWRTAISKGCEIFRGVERWEKEEKQSRRKIVLEAILGEDTFQCPNCDRKIQSSISLHSHLKTHKNEYGIILNMSEADRQSSTFTYSNKTLH